MKIPTHTGTVLGCDSRTPRGWSKKVLLRETKLYWCERQEWWEFKYRKSTGFPAGAGRWPLYRLDLDSIRPIEELRR